MSNHTIQSTGGYNRRCKTIREILMTLTFIKEMHDGKLTARLHSRGRDAKLTKCFDDVEFYCPDGTLLNVGEAKFEFVYKKKKQTQQPDGEETETEEVVKEVKECPIECQGKETAVPDWLRSILQLTGVDIPHTLLDGHPLEIMADALEAKDSSDPNDESGSDVFVDALKAFCEEETTEISFDFSYLCYEKVQECGDECIEKLYSVKLGDYLRLDSDSELTLYMWDFPTSGAEDDPVLNTVEPMPKYETGAEMLRHFMRDQGSWLSLYTGLNGARVNVALICNLLNRHRDCLDKPRVMKRAKDCAMQRLRGFVDYLKPSNINQTIDLVKKGGFKGLASDMMKKFAACLCPIRY